MVPSRDASTSQHEQTYGAERSIWNGCRWNRESRSGHYESYFLRANHPSKPQAFWIRYTIMSPKGKPGGAKAELWAIFFDGESHRMVVAKESVPFERCRCSREHLDLVFGEASLRDHACRGQAHSEAHEIAWSLHFQGNDRPIFLLPEESYEKSFPRAKSLVGMPNALFVGTLTVDGEKFVIDGWIGSQNHNWGSRHTDQYAWGQVASFDSDPNSFLEIATARVRLGPFWSPWFTLMVLRLEGEEYAFNSFKRAMQAKAHYEYFYWSFASRSPETRIHGRIWAEREDMVALRYENPPGGVRTCLNTNIGHCELTLERKGLPEKRLVAEHCAAFEILTRDQDHGVSIAI